MKNKYYFVYGTLKEGHHNNPVLGTSRKIGDFTTEPIYTMVSLGGYPGVVNGGSTAINGELYEVEDEYTEKGLDRLEGYTPGREGNLYNKEIITIDDKEAYIYIFNRDVKGYKEIENGTW